MKHSLNAKQVISLLRSGKRVSKDGITVIFSPKKKESSFSAVVSKRNIRSAVKRNYVKRVLREIIQTLLSRTGENYNVVVLYQQKEKDFNSIEKTMTDIWNIFLKHENK